MGEETDGAPGAASQAGSASAAPLPAAELVRIHRMTMRMAIAVAVVALGVLCPLGGALYAIGLCLGLAVGVWNLRALEGSLERISPESYKSGRNRFALGRMSRLGIITGLAVLLLVAVRAVGLGLVSGVGVFYAVMVLNMVVSLARTRRQSLAAEGGRA